MYKLRDYQQEAVDACMKYLEENDGKNPLIVAPTGAGKSIIIASLFKEMIKYDGMRAMMVTHVKELIEQNYQKVRAICPEYQFGLYSAGLNKKDTTKNITFASIQSAYKKAEEFGSINLIIVDEAHLISPSGKTRYQIFFNDLKKINPRLRVVGLTATPYRTGEGVIIGKGLFDDICYEIEIDKLIKDGYLSNLVSRGGQKKADMSGVKITAGDYNEKQMSEVFSDYDFENLCAQDLLMHGQNRKSWLLFCCDLKHARDMQWHLSNLGVSCGYISGKLSKKEREEELAKFKSGEYQALCNVGVLTTGFDFPQIDLVGLLRATISTTLYVQMVGRGMRVADDKENCLVLDFGGNVERHGAVNNIHVTKRQFKSVDDEDDLIISKTPQKECPECGEFCHTRAKFCPVCEHEFPINIDAKSADVKILIDKDEPREVQIGSVIYNKHVKPGKPPSLKVTYIPKKFLERAVSEWVCLEHDGYAYRKAIEWWNKRSPYDLPPELIDEALERVEELREPVSMIVKQKGKYDEIDRFIFEDEDT